MSDRHYVSVHDAHCCPIHGCKYGDEDCPVVMGLEQGLGCESCDYERDRQAKESQRNIKLRLQHVKACQSAEELIRKAFFAGAQHMHDHRSKMPAYDDPKLITLLADFRMSAKK